jgi:hypothetical protein
MLQRTKNFDLDFNKLHLVLAEIHKINNMPHIVNCKNKTKEIFSFHGTNLILNYLISKE